MLPANMVAVQYFTNESLDLHVLQGFLSKYLSVKS